MNLMMIHRITSLLSVEDKTHSTVVIVQLWKLTFTKKLTINF